MFSLNISSFSLAFYFFTQDLYRGRAFCHGNLEKLNKRKGFTQLESLAVPM